VFYVVVFISGISLYPTDLRLTALGCLALSVAGLPFLGAHSKINWMSSWSLFYLSTPVALIARSLFIDLDYPNAQLINAVLLLGRPKEDVQAAMMVLIFAIGSAAIGYLTGGRAKWLTSRQLFRREWDETRLVRTCWVVLSLSISAFCLYVRQYGTETLSHYRGVSTDLADYRANGYLFAFAGLSHVVIVLAWTGIIIARLRSKSLYFIFVLSIAVSIALAIYSSSRGSILVTALTCVAITYYKRNFSIRLFRTIIIFAVALTLVDILYQLRVDSTAQVSIRNASEMMQPVIVSMTFIDASKTAQVIALVPDKLSYQFGKTYLNILLAWIPRQLWPEKPPNLDTQLGNLVFGQQVYGSAGLPCGQVAELFLNFSYPGIFVGCFFFGRFSKYLDTWLEQKRQNPNAVVIYATTCMLLVFEFFGSTAYGILTGVIFILCAQMIILNSISVQGQRKRIHNN